MIEVTLEVCYKVIFDTDTHSADDIWDMELKEVRKFAGRNINVSSNMVMTDAKICEVKDDAPERPDNSVQFPFAGDDE